MMIPDKLSVHDKDYDAVLGARLHVFVNGNEQSKVISYDISAGVVVRYETSADNQIILRRGGDDASIETVHGSVVVTLV